MISLAPRYRLDDEHPWLIGIDPLRRYWIAVNGDETHTAVLPGLQADTLAELKAAVMGIRDLAAGDRLELPTAMGNSLEVRCVAENCFAIADSSNGVPVEHCFDQESLESLLMTAHPDWRCAPQHLELGRRQLNGAWTAPAVAKAA